MTKRDLRKILNRYLTIEVDVIESGGGDYSMDIYCYNFFYRKELFLKEIDIDYNEVTSLKKWFINNLLDKISEKDNNKQIDPNKETDKLIPGYSYKVGDVLKKILGIEELAPGLCYDPDKKFTRKEMDEAVEKLFRDNPEDTEILRQVMLALAKH